MLLRTRFISGVIVDGAFLLFASACQDFGEKRQSPKDGGGDPDGGADDALNASGGTANVDGGTLTLTSRGWWCLGTSACDSPRNLYCVQTAP
jgi:hypothetical protein